jgi:hypothetical protein
MLCRAVLVRTDVSEELTASIIRVTRIGELGTVAVTSNRRIQRSVLVTANVVPSSLILVNLMVVALNFSETFVCRLLANTTLDVHCRENFNFYIINSVSCV